MPQLRNLQTRRLDDSILIPEQPSRNEFVAQRVPKKVVLVIGKMQLRIILQISEPLVFGRSFSENEVVSFIDLEAFGAEDLGVSRKHLRCWADNGELFIEDLGSLNGTYLNGVRLADHSPQQIHHADHIMLGGFEIALEFIFDLLA